MVFVGIDPVSSYMGGGVDSHKNADVRRVLAPVGELAERTGVAVVSVTHFSKGGAGASTKAIHRFIGSIAFTAAPRAAFVVMEDPDDKDRRLFLHGKNNLAKPPQGLAFRLTQEMVGEGKDILASSVSWESQPVTMTADEALSVGGTGEPTDRSDYVEFLRTALTDGSLPVKEIERQAVEAGLLGEDKPIGQSKPFRTARKELGVITEKSGMNDGWSWALPKMPDGAEDAL